MYNVSSRAGKNNGCEIELGKFVDNAKNGFVSCPWNVDVGCEMPARVQRGQRKVTLEVTDWAPSPILKV